MVEAVKYSRSRGRSHMPDTQYTASDRFARLMARKLQPACSRGRSHMPDAQYTASDRFARLMARKLQPRKGAGDPLNNKAPGETGADL